MSDDDLGTVLRTTGAVLPADFPSELYDAVNDHAVGLGHPTEEWKLFATAWNGVAYRFLAAAEAETGLTASIERDGASPVQPARSRQEMDIYDFSSAAVSAVECFGFAMFAACSMLEAPSVRADSPRFALATDKDRRRVSFEAAATAIAQAYPADPMGDAMVRVLQDREWTELEDWREVGFHRGQPGRRFQRGWGPDLLAPDSWGSALHRGIDVPLDEARFRAKRQWLAATLTSLVTAADAFLTRRIRESRQATE